MTRALKQNGKQREKEKKERNYASEVLQRKKKKSNDSAQCCKTQLISEYTYPHQSAW
jgi:hypothetical protein